MSAPYKRTRLWVDTPFQSRLLLRMGFYLLLYTAVVIHIAFLLELIGSLAAGPSRGAWEHYQEFLGQQRFLVLAFLLTAPPILYDLLKFSHRIAGPLFRCRTIMQDMAGGKPVSEFKPRKHDLMRDFFNAFNALILKWNARTGAATNGQTHNAIRGAAPSNDPLVASR
jgi:hypothetical protein